MSLQLSPEALLTEIDFQIAQKELEKTPFEIQIGLLDEKFAASFSTPASTATNQLRQKLQSAIDGQQKFIDDINIEITEFLNQRRLLEFEIDERQRNPPENLDLAGGGPIVIPGLLESLNNIINILNEQRNADIDIEIVQKEQTFPLKELY